MIPQCTHQTRTSFGVSLNNHEVFSFFSNGILFWGLQDRNCWKASGSLIGIQVCACDDAGGHSGYWWCGSCQSWSNASWRKLVRCADSHVSLIKIMQKGETASWCNDSPSEDRWVRRVRNKPGVVREDRALGWMKRAQAVMKAPLLPAASRLTHLCLPRQWLNS